jgi:hypothetical protein
MTEERRPCQVKTWERVLLVMLKYILPPLIVLAARVILAQVLGPDLEQCISTTIGPMLI